MPMHCLHECFTLKELCELSKSWPLRVQPNEALFRGNILAWRVITVWLLQKYRLETAHCIFSPQHGADNRHWNWVLSHWLVNLPWRIFPQIQDQFYEAFFFKRYSGLFSDMSSYFTMITIYKKQFCLSLSITVILHVLRIGQVEFLRTN